MKYDFTTVPDRSHCGSSKWAGAPGSSTQQVPLSVADMEFPTAPPIKEALKKLADTTILGYTQPTEEYYQAVCSWMKRRHNFQVKKEWIVNTPGVVYALGLLIEASTKPGDSIIILTPVYYPFDMAAVAKGRRIVYSALIDNQGHYEIDYEDLESKAKQEKCKAILFCNPHNPVGRVWTKNELKKVADICNRNKVFIIDDEIHHDLIMPGYEHTVMAKISKNTHNNIAVCTAPSKTFNLAGLQCSNIIIPNEKIRIKAQACNMMNMQSNLNIFAYTGCIAAYNQCEEWLEELLVVVEENARYVEDFMKEHFPEVRICPLEGTYLQWLNMRGLGMNHRELRAMLEKAGIYLDNGEVFGPEGRGYERINLACARDTLEKTMVRFQAGVEEVRRDWEVNGKPYHKTLVAGQRLEQFVYDSPRGLGQKLAETVTKPTLIVFARFYECPVSQTLLKMVKGIYPALQFMGYDSKFVLQSDVETLTKAERKYPFELIADPKARLYDSYNIFEADGMTQMLAGDKLIDAYIGKNIHKLLDTSMVNMIASALDKDEEEAVKPRSGQMCAFVVVDKDMRILYSYYSRTMADFPNLLEMMKSLKR